MSNAIDVTSEILDERLRQIGEEGFDYSRDDGYVRCELARAAAAFAAFSKPKLAENIWPTSWSIDWLKAKNYRHALIKAGALIIAEIERIDRMEAERVNRSEEDK